MNALRELTFQELIAKRDALAQEMHASMSQSERDVWRNRYWSVQSEINLRTRTPRLVESYVEDDRQRRREAAWFSISMTSALFVACSLAVLILWLTVTQ